MPEREDDLMLYDPSPASAARTSTPRASSPPASSLGVGASVDGRYVLKRLLARGGAAHVYAAEHTFTRRQVAIKLSHDASAVARARLAREVDVLAHVRGDGIVEMLDAGQVGDELYIVFELLDGRTLAGLLAARGQLGIPETVKIGIEVARALERCHSRSVVHRDLKPSNLFVTMNREHQMRLLDFGIAKLVEAAPEKKLTQENALLGTPEYMAPESLLSLPSADHRVDVYGLGVTLYECLTGAVPFDGAYAEVLMKLSTTAPRSVKELRPEVPDALAAVIDKSLARAPEDRFQSIGEMRRALELSLAAPTADIQLIPSGMPEARRNVDAPTIADSPTPKASQQPAYRRKHARAPYTTLARAVSATGQRIDGRVEEVSEGGLQFVGDRAVPTGESVKLRFALPASGRVTEVSATARWNRNLRGTNATGFEFADLADSAREEIGQYVKFMCAS